MGKEQTTKKESRWRSVWRVISPWWKSEEKWLAGGLYLLVILLDFSSVGLAAWVTYWKKNFFDAFTEYNLSQVWILIGVALIISALTVLATTLRTWFCQTLEIRWRRWLTEVYSKKWLSDSVFYRIEMRGSIDNADQRISQDLKDMVNQTLDLSLGFIKNLVSLVSFSIIIWNMSGAFSLVLGGWTLSIPGYMLWASIIYALVASIFIEKFSRRMVSTEYEQQLRDADFRFLMMRIRENSAQIALSKGGSAEYVTSKSLFERIEKNWKLFRLFTARINIIENGYTELGVILSYILIIPRYFAREITLGSIMQLTMSFTNVRVGFAWFVYKYKKLATLRSIFLRLAELDNAMSEPDHEVELYRRCSDDDAIHIRNLQLYYPSGAPMCSIPDIDIKPGDRLVVKGPSGTGKTTFLKAIAGIWPHGKGSIRAPKTEMMFFPQESYLPLSSLKGVMSYPNPADSVSDARCCELLSICSLERYIPELNQEGLLWSRRLSPGEKQRLAFARALLLRPSFLFLDEATSAMDIILEKHMMETLVAALPNTAIVSIAHRPSLEQYHNKTLYIHK